MDLVVALGSLGLLMLAAYRGHSVILLSPLCALLAVAFTDPRLVLPMFSAVFMEKMVGFLKLYFPVFMLGAVFGKVIELSGFSKAIVAAVLGGLGRDRAMLAIVLVCAVLTYGGVSLFVVVFAVYPFAAEMFRQAEIPKRLIPGTIALGAFTFTMDSLPGSPQIQNIIPTTFFKTTTWAAPWLGVVGSTFIVITGLSSLTRRRRQAAASGEGYGTDHTNEPEPFKDEALPHPALAATPLVLVAVLNRAFTSAIPALFAARVTVPVPGHPVDLDVTPLVAIWAVECALVVGILSVVALAWSRVVPRFAEGSRSAVAGALLASMNTASE